MRTSQIYSAGLDSRWRKSFFFFFPSVKMRGQRVSGWVGCEKWDGTVWERRREMTQIWCVGWGRPAYLHGWRIPDDPPDSSLHSWDVANVAIISLDLPIGAGMLRYMALSRSVWSWARQVGWGKRSHEDFGKSFWVNSPPDRLWIMSRWGPFIRTVAKKAWTQFRRSQVGKMTLEELICNSTVCGSQSQ